MIPTILEICACLIAAIAGFTGLIIGLNNYSEQSVYLVLSSGLLVFVVFAYLTNVSELQQMSPKDNSIKMIICKVTHKSIYVIFAIQIIAATLMVI